MRHAPILTAGDALLRDIIENPADDAPRLIYADWLEEEGGQAERAEFIRVQIRLERLNAELMSDEDCDGVNCPGCAERRLLTRRMEGLWCLPAQGFGTRQRPAGWTAMVSEDQQVLADVSPLVFVRRGFVHAVRCPLAAWYAHGRAICGTHPVESLSITDRTPRHTPGGIKHDPAKPWDWFSCLSPADGDFCKRHPHFIPNKMFGLVDGEPVTWADYASEEDAFADMSRRLLRWAKDPAPPQK